MAKLLHEFIERPIADSAALRRSVVFRRTG